MNRSVEDLEKELEEMKSLMIRLSGMGTSDNNPERDVLVVSLTNNVLAVSTEGYGQGVVYKFNKFGEEQIIPANDLKMIIRNNKSFIVGGRLYICDEEIVRKNQLTKVYEKILNKEKLEELLVETKTTFAKIFKNMTRIQQETISEMLMQKIMDDKNVDFNLIDIVDKTLNIDLQMKAKQAKELFESEKPEK